MLIYHSHQRKHLDHRIQSYLLYSYQRDVLIILLDISIFYLLSVSVKVRKFFHKFCFKHYCKTKTVNRKYQHESFPIITYSTALLIVTLITASATASASATATASASATTCLSVSATTSASATCSAAASASASASTTNYC